MFTFENVPIEVVLGHPDAQPPKKAHDSDLGWDVCVVPDDEWITQENKLCYTLHPGCTKIFSTGLTISVPSTYGFVLRDRSGLAAKNQIHHLAGAIEGTYRGEWKIILTNLGKESKVFYVGDKIVQALLMPIIPATVKVVDVLSETDRGMSGFGSSGR